MAIQFKRGADAKRKESTEKLLAGQPFYETDTSKLYIGDGSTELKALKPVNPLPTATKETLGGVKIGDNIKVDEEGMISVPTATASTAGLVKPLNVTDKPSVVKLTSTEDKYYGVQASGDGSMFVNVPWVAPSAGSVSWHSELCYRQVDGKNQVHMPANKALSNMTIPITSGGVYLAVLVFDEATWNNTTNKLAGTKRIAQSAPFAMVNKYEFTGPSWEVTDTYVPVYLEAPTDVWNTVGAWVSCEGIRSDTGIKYTCLLNMNDALSASETTTIRVTVHYLAV